MNILFLVNTFPPEIRSAGLLYHELGRELVKRGHRVTVITSLPLRHTCGEVPPRYRRKIVLREEIDGIHVIRLAGIPVPRGVPLLRGVEHFSTALVYFLGSLRAEAFDVALVYSPPLTLGLTAWAAGALRRAPFVFNVQDIYPQCLVDMGLLKSRLLIRLFESIERFSYQKAAAITVHSEGNGRTIASRVPDPGRIVVIPNWVDIEQIHPGVDGLPFRRRHDLGSRYVVSFAGAMGFAQDLDTVVDAAGLLRNREEIRFLLVGEGVERGRLEGKVRVASLGNVRFLPFQPKEVYPEVLAASEISLVSLRKELVTPTVPGKLLNIMAAGKPVIAQMDLAGDAPRMVREAGCGLCVEPGNPAGLAEAILRLQGDPALARDMGERGRAHAVGRFSLRACTELYIAAFEKAIASRKNGGGSRR